MRPDKVVQLRRLQSERERRAALDLARANAVVHGAVAALGVALDEQAAFRARRREREGTIYAALIEKPVRTVELELLHMELEALFRMEGVVQARVEEAERVVRDAEAELATVRSGMPRSHNAEDHCSIEVSVAAHVECNG